MLKTNNSTNSMNNNKLNMKGNDNMKNKSMNMAQQYVNNGTVYLSTLLNMKEVDMSQCQNPISVMHKIYNPISEVGLVTVVCTNVYAVDVTTKQGFETFKEALKMAKTEEDAEHVKYESIWVEGYNKFSEFDFATGQHYEYYNVTNVEMEMLAKRLSAININKLTVEEAQLIQSDLPAIIRAWQESSIDVSKDKSKVFAYSYKQFFNNTKTKSSYIKKYRNEINFGFKEVKAAKKDSKEIPNFKFQLEGLENVAQDSVGICNQAFVEAAEEYLNDEIKDVYALSDNRVLEQFTGYALSNPEFAYILTQLINVLRDAFRLELTIDKEILKDMRNYAYTKAIELEIDKHDVIKIAIATAMSKVYRKKDDSIYVETDIDKYNASAIKQIFPNEYIEMFAGKQTVELTIVDCDDIEDGQEIVFLNGYSEEEGLCELEEDFTGIAYECNGSLVYDIDAYEFEICEAFLLEKTYKEGTTAQDIKADSENKTEKALDKGQYAISKLEQAKEVKITGAHGHIVKANDEFIGRIYPSKELKGDHTVKSVFTLPAENGKQQLAFVVLG